MAIVNILNSVNKNSRNPIVISVIQNSNSFHSNCSQLLQPSRKKEGHNHVTDATHILSCRQRTSFVIRQNLAIGESYAKTSTELEYG